MQLTCLVTSQLIPHNKLGLKHVSYVSTVKMNSQLAGHQQVGVEGAHEGDLDEVLGT